MARPIEPTRTLTYEESLDFLSRLGSNNNGVYTDEKGVEKTRKYIEQLHRENKMWEYTKTTLTTFHRNKKSVKKLIKQKDRISTRLSKKNRKGVPKKIFLDDFDDWRERMEEMAKRMEDVRY